MHFAVYLFWFYHCLSNCANHIIMPSFVCEYRYFKRIIFYGNNIWRKISFFFKKLAWTWIGVFLNVRFLIHICMTWFSSCRWYTFRQKRLLEYTAKCFTLTVCCMDGIVDTSFPVAVFNFNVTFLSEVSI